MPSYDYRCKNCQIQFTIERSMNDSSATNCIDCDSSEVTRIWNVQFIASSRTASPSCAPEEFSGPGCCGGSCN